MVRDNEPLSAALFPMLNHFEWIEIGYSNHLHKQSPLLQVIPSFTVIFFMLSSQTSESDFKIEEYTAFYIHING